MKLDAAGHERGGIFALNEAAHWAVAGSFRSTGPTCVLVGDFDFAE